MQGQPRPKAPTPYPLDSSPPEAEPPKNAEAEDGEDGKEAASATTQSEEDTVGAEVSSESDATFSKAALQPELSKQVHIVGFTRKARFLAHALSPIPQLPPVKILAHNNRSVAAKWLDEGRAINLHDDRGTFISSHPIQCPEYFGPRINSPVIGRWNGGLLDNVIVNTRTNALYPTLRSLRHAMDNRTILCLIHPGLGYIERLNEDIFDNPAVRPTYVLAHMTHKLTRHCGQAMSLRIKDEGEFLMSVLPRGPTGKLEPYEELQRKHLFALLSMSRALDPKGMAWRHFLHRKLPGMIWSSVADTISVILGCRYDQIFQDTHAAKLWHGLLDETIDIVVSLPEFEGRPFLSVQFTSAKFRAGLKMRLGACGSTYSEWISQIRRGDITDVDFINGYFVKRAEELGIDCRLNKLAVSMVKARHQARTTELRGAIPFSLRPYMLDRDKLGGSEYKGVPDLDL